MDDVENTPVDEQVDETQDTEVDGTESPSNAPVESDTDTEEKLYAGKYKTLEELERGYKNLESKLGQRTQPEDDPYVPPKRTEATPDEVLQSLLADDGSGNIDPIKLIQFTKEQAKEDIRREQNANEFEKNDWQNAVKKYPQLAENEKLAEMIKNQRLAMIVSGKGYLPYATVAKDIIGELTAKEQAATDKGREEAQVTEKIVSRAAISEPSGDKAPTADESEKAELERLMRSKDYGIASKARTQYVSKYL